jgi:hypothetical protein
MVDVELDASDRPHMLPRRKSTVRASRKGQGAADLRYHYARLGLTAGITRRLRCGRRLYAT